MKGDGVSGWLVCPRPFSIFISSFIKFLNYTNLSCVFDLDSKFSSIF